MNITYSQNGDYRIPNIVIRKTKPIGHYGRLRKAYLETYRPVLFNELVLSDTLYEHCAEINEAARNRMELIVRSLAEQNGVTEQLKAEMSGKPMYAALEKMQKSKPRKPPFVQRTLQRAFSSLSAAYRRESQ